uniref:Branched-chain amino acid ABC-type transport system, permease component n=1 Tax=Candidatus Kentrum sp. FW TaxID=2126338 RepID=A0A450U2N8_9GAMM|nr:MAG: Branched-chain amino acid ABC-type transport system, permease component [Candidatus Kentron sp. FW]
MPAAHLDNYLLSLAISAPFVYGIGLFRTVFGYFNFALGGYFSFALYATYLFGQGKAPGGITLILGIVAISLALHYFLFQPMRRSGASPDRLLIVGLGIYIIFEQFLSIGFGDRIRFGVSSGSMMELVGISIPPDVLLIAGASAIVAMFLLLMRFSETGEAIRALAENESLTRIVGISVPKTGLIVLLCSTALVVAGGILASMEIGAYPTAGFQPVVLAFAVSLLGGSVFGARYFFVLIGLVAVEYFTRAFIAAHWSATVTYGFVLIGLLIANLRANRFARSHP